VKDISDYELRKVSDEPTEPPQPPWLSKPWIAVALLLALAGVAVYLYLRPSPAPVPSPTESVEAVPEAGAPLGREPMEVALPALDQSDAFVRTLIATLSSHPTLAAWLATNGLVRNFTVVVTNIADGATPAVHLARLRPKARFEVIERNGRQAIDPRSYERYTTFATAVASIDPAGAARLYATLKPLIEEASRDLGSPNASFDVTLEQAIVRLLGTPILKDPVYVVPHGIGYAFEDPSVEALSPAQKQLLRFGPRNVQLIQGALSDIALALGISPQRLPVAGGRAARPGSTP
jgi:Protein of unknown function (DUF3014)